MPHKRHGRSLNDCAPGADADHALIRLYNIAGSGEQKSPAFINGNHHGLQPPEIFICSPLSGQLDCGPGKIAVEPFQLAFKSLGKMQGIRSCSCKPHDNFFVIYPPDFFGLMLDNGGIKRYLAIACNNYLPLVSKRQYCRSVKYQLSHLTFLDAPCRRFLSALPCSHAYISG